MVNTHKIVSLSWLRVVAEEWEWRGLPGADYLKDLFTFLLKYAEDEDPNSGLRNELCSQ
jgi:hypothetical protein